MDFERLSSSYVKMFGVQACCLHNACWPGYSLRLAQERQHMWQEKHREGEQWVRLLPREITTLLWKSDPTAFTEKLLREHIRHLTSTFRREDSVLNVRTPGCKSRFYHWLAVSLSPKSENIGFFPYCVFLAHLPECTTIKFKWNGMRKWGKNMIFILLFWFYIVNSFCYR